MEAGLPIRTVWEKVVEGNAGLYPRHCKYENDEVFHARPMSKLEDQMCTWIPGEGPSPDRLDALNESARSGRLPGLHSSNRRVSVL